MHTRRTVLRTVLGASVPAARRRPMDGRTDLVTTAGRPSTADDHSNHDRPSTSRPRGARAVVGSATPVADTTVVGASGDLPIDEAIDADDNGEIDASEILATFEYWRRGAAVPDTGGKTIGVHELHELIEMWLDDTPV